MSAADEIDVVQDCAAPLALAIGRVVLGVAVLEKVLLVSLVMRGQERSGGVPGTIGEELARWQRRSAGRLLAAVRRGGLDDALYERVDDVIRRRNELVHHLLEDITVALALETGHRLDELVLEIAELTRDCQAVIDELAPDAFAGLESKLGLTVSELSEALAWMEPGTVEEPVRREALEFARSLRGSLLWEPRLRESRLSSEGVD